MQRPGDGFVIDFGSNPNRASDLRLLPSPRSIVPRPRSGT
jgi:hypothetical protein